MHKFIAISCLFFACATGEQINAHKAPPAATSPPVALNDYARPPEGDPADAKDYPKEKGAPTRKSAWNEGGRSAASGSAAAELSQPSEREPAPHPVAAPPASALEDRFSDKGAESEARAAKPQASVGGAVASRSPPPPPRDRLGLATSWGETRYAPVDQVEFARDASQPNCQGSLWYNDRSGAEAAGRNAAWSSARLPIGCGVTLELHDDNGNALSAVRSGGRVYAVGESNQRYTITVHNYSNARYEMVVSVDGLDVIDGRAAGFDKRGYLVPAHGSLDIEGFRRSGSEVAAFRFGAVSDSYAARTTGSARNVGVIGLAAFAERGSLPNYSYRELEQRRTADPFPNRYAPVPKVANYETVAH